MAKTREVPIPLIFLFNSLFGIKVQNVLIHLRRCHTRQYLLATWNANLGEKDISGSCKKQLETPLRCKLQEKFPRNMAFSIAAFFINLNIFFLSDLY